MLFPSAALATTLVTSVLSLAFVSSDPSSPSSSSLGLKTQRHLLSGQPFKHVSLKEESTAPANAKLVYQGGKIIPSVKVFLLYWKSSPSNVVNYAGDQLENFYKAITYSPWFDVLSREYNTPTQKIGARGSVIGSHEYVGSSASLTDKQIQDTLTELILKGQIPSPGPDPNVQLLITIHFGTGISITNGQGAGSCVSGGFCGYHGTVNSTLTLPAINSNGGQFYYSVLPDQGGGCLGGCGGSSDTFQNLCSVSSHELSEAITDPAIGIAGDFVGPILGFYDRTNGEIGDLCNAQLDSTISHNGKGPYTGILPDF